MTVPPDTRTPVERGITKIVSSRTGKVSWEVRWSGANAAGARVYGYKRCRTLKDARAERAKRTTEIRAGTYQPANKETVGAYAARWLDRMERTHWATSTAYTRRAQYRTHIAPVLGGARLTAVSRDDCQRLVDGLVGAGLRPNTVITVAALLSGLFHAAELDGIIARTPARSLTLPTARPAPVTVWTGAQVDRFLAATAEDLEAPLWRLLLTTGLRIGEALALRWADCDLARRLVTVAATMRKQADGTDAPAVGTKSGQVRTVPLMPETAAALAAHQARQGDARRVAKVWDVRGFVFADGAGRPWSYSVVVKRWHGAVRGAVLPRMTLHGTRHTCATLMMERGVHPVAVARVLGHRTVAMTLDTYSHADTALQRDAVEALRTAITPRCVESAHQSTATGEKRPSS